MDLGRAVRAFFEAAETASAVLAAPAVAQRWADPSALEGFSVGGLAGHLGVAGQRLEAALDEPLPGPAVAVELADFYGVNRVARPDGLNEGFHQFIRDDGEQRAQQGSDRVAQRFDAVIARLRARLPNEGPDRLVPVLRVPDGVASLDAYVATRVVELVVHTDDLAASVDMPPAPVAPLAATVAIEVFVELARARVGDLEVIRAFTRREWARPDALRVL